MKCYKLGDCKRYKYFSRHKKGEPRREIELTVCIECKREYSRKYMQKYRQQQAEKLMQQQQNETSANALLQRKWG